MSTKIFLESWRRLTGRAPRLGGLMDNRQVMVPFVNLRMIGRPGRIAALDRIIAHMNRQGGVWFATRRQIAEHWRTRFG